MTLELSKEDYKLLTLAIGLAADRAGQMNDHSLVFRIANLGYKVLSQRFAQDPTCEQDYLTEDPDAG